MKRKRILVIIIIVVVLGFIGLATGGNPYSLSSSKAVDTEYNMEAVDEPATYSVDESADFGVDIVSVTDEGVTYSFDYRDSSQDSCQVIFSQVKVGGKTYSRPNTDEGVKTSPIQFIQNGEELSIWMLNLSSGSPQELTVKCEDVSTAADYVGMQITFDEQLYNSSGGKHWDFNDLHITLKD